MNKKAPVPKIITVFTILLVLLVLSLIANQFYAHNLDEVANGKFAEKAKKLQLKGKDQEFVKKHFGLPSYTYLSDGNSIWVYMPGPRYMFLRHECKIAIDMNGLVVGWAVRLD